MRRGLNNWIRFGDEEELTLTHGTSMQGGRVVCDWYDVEGGGRRIRYLPEELAELRAAIDEMLRMAEQHRDALTDGAGKWAAEAEPVPAVALVLTQTEMDTLCMLAATSITIKLGYPDFLKLWNCGLIEVTEETVSLPTAQREHIITDAGRRALGAQTPEAERESEPNEAEADLGTGNAMDLLRWLGSEHRVASYHEAFEELFNGGLLTHRVGDDYAISDKGRRVLAERE